MNKQDFKAWQVWAHLTPCGFIQGLHVSCTLYNMCMAQRSLVSGLSGFEIQTGGKDIVCLKRVPQYNPSVTPLSVSSTCKTLLSLINTENSCASFKTLLRYCFLCEAFSDLCLLCITFVTYNTSFIILIYIIRCLFIFVQFLAKKSTQKVI